jgi:hypothetical protein
MGYAMSTMTDDHRLMPDGAGWQCFQETAIKLASSQRTNRPRLAMELILESADGYAACRVTNAMFANRIGCTIPAASETLSTLERLGLIRCIRDPRISEGRWIVLAQHFSASAVLTELAQSQRVVDRNEDLESFVDVAEEHTAVEDDNVNLSQNDDPDVIPFDTGLGRLLRQREQARGSFDRMAF